MGIEGETTVPSERAQKEPQINGEEHLRRATDLDARIHGEEEPEEVTPQEQPDTDDESEAESMARQVPDEITEGMLGG